MSVTIVPGQKLTEMPNITSAAINDLMYVVKTSNDTSYNITVSSLAQSIIPSLSNTFVYRSGDTMTGHLTLTGVPINVNDAANKGYVDTAVASISTMEYVLSAFLPLSGGTMTGNIILTGNPLFTNDAANKGYVDTKLSLAGGTLTGPLYLHANPVVGNQAVNKTYVDNLSNLASFTVGKVYNRFSQDSSDTNDNSSAWMTIISDGLGKLRASGLFGVGYNGGNGYYHHVLDEFRPYGIQYTSSTEKALSVLGMGYSTWVLSNSGRIYSTGYNRYGQLGLGDFKVRTIFHQITSLEGEQIKQITMSSGNSWRGDNGWILVNSSFAINQSGQAWAWGSNGSGQLGLANPKGNGPALYSPKNTYFPGPTAVNIGGVNNRVHKIVTTGWTTIGSSFAILSTNEPATNNQLYATGYNAQGQLGLGDYATRYTFTPVPDVRCDKIFTGALSYVTYAISGGYLSAAGYNSTGQLGNGQLGAAQKFGNTTFRPVYSADALGNIGVMQNVDYVCVNNGYKGYCSVACLTKNKEIYTWGFGANGTLGTGDKLNRLYATYIGTADKIRLGGYAGSAVLVALTGNDIYTTGYVRYGIDGQGDGADYFQYSLQRVPRPQWVNYVDFEFFVFDVGSVFNYIIAIDDTANIWGWGANLYGQLGIRSTGRGGISQPDRIDFPTAITIQMR